jgi:hypothetical protein
MAMAAMVETRTAIMFTETVGIGLWDKN